ncbi:MAG: succinate dehydrogenase [Gammaproteobacteria bacterium]|nr:succinate dehydrogenase [Gammaproteobacteria bacterium]
MLRSVTSLTRSGLRDWLVQRITAIVLAGYVIFLVGFFMLNQPMSFGLWTALFQNGFMRIFTFLALLSMVYHTWVGMWTVLTDYINCPRFRLLLVIVIVLSLFSYLAWAVAIVWGLR